MMPPCDDGPLYRYDFESFTRSHSAPQPKKGTTIMARILWIVLVVLLVLWLVGFLTHVAGSLIHILLVVALVVLVINLITGRKTL